MTHLSRDCPVVPRVLPPGAAPAFAEPFYGGWIGRAALDAQTAHVAVSHTDPHEIHMAVCSEVTPIPSRHQTHTYTTLPGSRAGGTGHAGHGANGSHQRRHSR
ncbi:hypothetical protein CLV78_103378 [Aliiruegeria haliotis]|uniref:Uncharacterized protein n=1 Tax=Aliiruegeria haliotis TaxID=1280846 RepID=A0A2T0RTL4_9RHOB|nr:hypothetical protein [Aliiruegeria haliotis]PRY24511.1 hypothetical protein CLV78_103378 [Aliiruegeria haliotis]